MKNINKKLRSKKGETLVETMVSMVVMALSMMLLAALLNTANKLNSKAVENDKIFYQQLSAVEKADPATAIGDGTLKVTYGANTYSFSDIKLYGTDDGLISYRKKEGP